MRHLVVTRKIRIHPPNTTGRRHPRLPRSAGPGHYRQGGHRPGQCVERKGDEGERERGERRGGQASGAGPPRLPPKPSPSFHSPRSPSRLLHRPARRRRRLPRLTQAPRAKLGGLPARKVAEARRGTPACRPVRFRQALSPAPPPPGAATRCREREALQLTAPLCPRPGGPVSHTHLRSSTRAACQPGPLAAHGSSEGRAAECVGAGAGQHSGNARRENARAPTGKRARLEQATPGLARRQIPRHGLGGVADQVVGG